MITIMVKIVFFLKQNVKRSTTKNVAAVALNHRTTTLADLPNDIIINILSRLPVKCISQFRCVRKSWRTLLSSSQFIKLHSIQSSKTTPKLWYVQKSNYDCYHLNDYANVAAATVDAMLHFRVPPRGLMLGGTCNGLVCIYIGASAFFKNFYTKEINRLPQLQPRLPIFFGLGHDAFNDDYKVIEGSFFIKDRQLIKDKITLNVFSTRTQLWKTIDAPISHIPSGESPVLVNRYLNWRSRYSYSSKVQSPISCFDIRREIFSTVPMPDKGEGEEDELIIHGLGGGLGVLRGCLCITKIYKNYFVVWNMKEYGVKESWTKLIKVNYPNEQCHFDPIFYDKNGQIVMKMWGRTLCCFVKINCEEKSLAMRKSFRKQYPKNFQVTTCVHSLVSPFGYNEKEEAIPSNLV